MFKGFFAALGFLTIIPPPGAMGADAAAFRRAPGYFPLVGIMEGAFFALLGLAALRTVGPYAAAGFILAARAIITGGLHLDGLSDTFDSLAARGTAKGDRLQAMKGGPAGPAGVAAVALTLIIKFALLSRALSASRGPLPALAAVFFMPVAARWGMVMNILHGHPAKKDGLGAMVSANTDLAGAVRATIFAAIPVLLWIFYLKGGGFLPVSFTAVYAFSIASDVFCRKRFGGITGDTIGATSELSEMIFLIPAACIGYF